MSFEIKYDSQGAVIRDREFEKKISAAASETQDNAEIPSEPAPILEQIDQETHIESPSEQLESPVKEDPKEEDLYVKNYRAIRTKAERLEKERDEAIRRLQEAETDRQQKSRPQEQSQPEEDISVAPDDLVEGKHLSKLGRKIKNLEDQLQRHEQQQRQHQRQSMLNSTEINLKARFPDFEKIVSDDNLNMLKDAFPELHSTIYQSDNLYNKAVSAYTLIKKLGIHREDIYVQEKAAVQRNAAKPRPLASVSPQQGDTPLSKANAFANGLTDAVKAQLYREMIDVIKSS